MRVSECCTLTVGDLDLFMDTVLVHGKGKKQRYIPFGSYARDALELYINSGRQCLLEKQKSLMMCCLSIKEAADRQRNPVYFKRACKKHPALYIYTRICFGTRLRLIC